MVYMFILELMNLKSMLLSNNSNFAMSQVANLLKYLWNTISGMFSFLLIKSYIKCSQ